MGIPSLLGLDASVNRIFPNSTRADQLLSASSTGGTNSSAQVRRNETIALRVAATVTQMLPKGNLVVSGRQQVRVNSELRDLQVAGIIRPQDIAWTIPFATTGWPRPASSMAAAAPSPTSSARAGGRR